MIPVWAMAFFLVVGFICLSGGADLLCKSAMHLARAFGLKSVTGSVFLISVGTSLPDLVAVATAVIEGHPNISMGNILGSNFANLALGLGIGALIKPFACDKKLLKFEFPLLATVTVIFVGCCLNGHLGRVEGLMLLLVFGLYVFCTFGLDKTHPVADHAGGQSLQIWGIGRSALVFFVSAIILAMGAHLVVTSCCEISDKFGISQNFVGFSLVALGTCAPEIFVVALAAKHNQHSICAGNIVGSNLINLLLVAGICALFWPVSFEKTAFMWEAGALLAITLTTWIIFYKRAMFSRKIGISFVLFYFIVMFFVSAH